MKVLVSLLTDTVEDIHLARRKVAYDRLVLVVHPVAGKIAEEVARAERDDDVVETVEIEGRDVHEALERLRRVVESYGPEDTITLNAAGGHAGLVTAMIMLAYEEGLRTLFVQEGHVERLPVLEGVRLEDQVGEDEGRLLRLPWPSKRPLETLEDETGWGRRKIERICRQLKDKGLGEMTLADGKTVFGLTPTGAWIREQMTA